MPNKVSNLEEVTFTNVGFGASFIHSASFYKWSHLHATWIFVWTNFFAYCIEAYKKDYLRPVHSSMHGLDGVAPFIK